ncbi:MAG: hypothetical protein ACOYVK_06620 [Bacillota bacterium]
MNHYRNDSYRFYRFPVSLQDTPSPDYLLLYEDRNKYQTLVNIIRYSKAFGTWLCIYAKLYTGYTGIKFYNQYWNAVNQKVLVLYSEPAGSGGFISYTVLGEEDGQIVEYISQENIFSGTVFFQDNQLIQGSGNQFKVWKKINDQFVLEPYHMPQYPDALVISYSIPNENTVVIDKTQYTVPVGAVIQFIREDFNDIPERLMFSSNPPCIEFIQFATFRVTCKTKMTTTIVPDAYNWDGAKNVIITAQ